MTSERTRFRRDTGLYEGEALLEVNGVRVRCTGDGAAWLGMAMTAGQLDGEKLRLWAAEHGEEDENS